MASYSLFSLVGREFFYNAFIYFFFNENLNKIISFQIDITVFEIQRYIIDKFKPIFDTVQFTCLDINYQKLPVRTLIEIIRFLSNLDLLKI